MTQQPYQDLVQQSQEAFKNAVDTWTKSVQDTLGSVGVAPNAPQVDPQQIVDQVFEFAEGMLAMQRDLTRSLIQTSLAVQQSQTAKGGTTKTAGK